MRRKTRSQLNNNAKLSSSLEPLIQRYVNKCCQILVSVLSPSPQCNPSQAFRMPNKKREREFGKNTTHYLFYLPGPSNLPDPEDCRTQSDPGRPEQVPLLRGQVLQLRRQVGHPSRLRRQPGGHGELQGSKLYYCCARILQVHVEKSFLILTHIYQQTAKFK